MARVTGDGPGGGWIICSGGNEYAGGCGASGVSIFSHVSQCVNRIVIHTVGPHPVLWRRRCGSSAYRSAALAAPIYHYLKCLELHALTVSLPKPATVRTYRQVLSQDRV